MGKKRFAASRYQLVVITLLAAAGVLVIYFQLDEPLRRHLKGVKAGVNLEGEALGGMFPSEVDAVVAKIAGSQGREPVNAELDEQREAIVPELNGLAVDREATVQKVMKAPPGTTVTPVYRELLPEVRWEHYQERPAYMGNPRKQAVALMINVAWGDSHLPAMLEALASEKCTATFFVAGRWAEKNEPLLLRLMAEGHEIGNHGYDDAVVFTDLDRVETTHSLQKTSEIIFAAAGYYPLYFTPHKGEFNTLTLEIVARQEMRTVLWSLDTVDWMKPGVEAMYNKISGSLAPGVIILMHPTEDTVALLKLILPLIRERGLTVVTVEQLMDPSWFPGSELQ